MFKVNIINDNIVRTIHDYYISDKKVSSGQIVEGINSIDSFSFSLYPDNPGFNSITEYSTKVQVFDMKKNILVFDGRILLQSSSMSDSGLICKEITCESVAGYFCDSVQPYVDPKNWTTVELLTFLIENHNSQTEEYKHFSIGNISYLPEENIYIGIQRGNTWDNIKTKVLDKIGGELKIYRQNGHLFIDLVEEIGYHSVTSIEIGKNMKAITKESDPSSFITRLIPLGAKKKIKEEDENGKLVDVETEERIGIESVNNDIPYIEDSLAVQKFGIITNYQTWDNVNDPSILLTKARKFLSDSNKVIQKYSITALDLNLIGLELDNFQKGNYYQVKNNLLNINEELRIIKKTTDIINYSSSSLEFGSSSKTLSEIQNNKEKDLIDRIETIEANYVPNEGITQIVDEQIKNNSTINQMPDKILSEVSETYEARLVKINEQVEDVTENLNSNYPTKSDIDSSFKETEDSIKIIKEEIVKVQQTASDLNISITNINQYGVNRVVTTTGYRFDENGLDISKTGTEMHNLITNLGMFVKRDTEEVLGADNTGVRAENITVRNYLNIGKNSRIEDYLDDQTAIFFVGGA